MSDSGLNKIKLSVLILTKNNESTLDKTISSVFGWTDEIIILDSGSTDNTKSISQKYNCNFHFKEFNGFGEQKYFAVNLARNDWVFILDSDEVVSDDLKSEIISQIPSKNYSGFLTPITLIFLGKKMKFGRENKMPHLRIFNKKFGNYNNSKVHEDVKLDGKTRTLKSEILHFSYTNLSEYFEKFNRYTSLAAEDMNKKGRKANSLQIIFRFPIQFFQTYIIHLNFLNGFHGFLWSLCSAFYPVIKLSKLKLINESQEK